MAGKNKINNQLHNHFIYFIYTSQDYTYHKPDLETCVMFTISCNTGKKKITMVPKPIK